MDAAGRAPRHLDVPEDRVHKERFTAVQAPADATARPRPQKMTVLDDGQTVVTTTVVAGQSLVEPGPAAGVAMEHSCTVGNCGTCMVRLRHGQVTQIKPNCLTVERNAAGYVLACTRCFRTTGLAALRTVAVTRSATASFHM
ncbi:2Fe-2S iron-sulfur cluster-binding protein [Streptomyces antibioticus]|uniref:2Fe-2S iron-sulfur cluster-binding protein n=1 Tax=Streptomyces antibioticus TaxID=1890 RepID=UPI0036FCBFEF